MTSREVRPLFEPASCVAITLCPALVLGNRDDRPALDPMPATHVARPSLSRGTGQ